MNLHKTRHFVRKGISSTQATVWLCALPLALGLSLTAAAGQDAAGQETGQPSAEAPVEKLPEVRVGELSFKVTSLRISRVKPNKYASRDETWATLALTITNHGKEPIALDYKGGSASFVNEHGYAWTERHDLSGREISGLPVEGNNQASVDYVVDPGGQLSATIPLFSELSPNQSTGTTFNFQAVFSSFKDMGEGRLKRLRSYPVSFIGLKQSSTPEASGTDLKNGTSNSNFDLKGVLGRFFKN